ncbi:hypothetical protein L3V82_08050 [Thiotrichales bacterium 19S3-7]|nr:hypothetical protein [Thiotrichales bacterium 19S3-7]MCF6802112.1 hypothetical protein [Thiotrichales bacterium 19S3-11]
MSKYAIFNAIQSGDINSAMNQLAQYLNLTTNESGYGAQAILEQATDSDAKEFTLSDISDIANIQEFRNTLMVVAESYNSLSIEGAVHLSTIMRVLQTLNYLFPEAPETINSINPAHTSAISEFIEDFCEAEVTNQQEIRQAQARALRQERNQQRQQPNSCTPKALFLGAAAMAVAVTATLYLGS